MKNKISKIIIFFFFINNIKKVNLQKVYIQTIKRATSVPHFYVVVFSKSIKKLITKDVTLRILYYSNKTKPAIECSDEWKN